MVIHFSIESRYISYLEGLKIGICFTKKRSKQNRLFNSYLRDPKIKNSIEGRFVAIETKLHIGIDSELAAQEKINSYSLKFCVLGDGGVGKTTLVERLATGNFNPITKMTIGIDFSLINLNVMQDGHRESTPVNITVWDLGGEDRFRFMLPSYIQGADGGIVLFDVTRFTSAMSLPEWMKMWKGSTTPDVPLYLVGSKFDLVNPAMYPMIENNIQNLKRELGIKIHFLISTKSGMMIDDLMHSVTKDMLKRKNQPKPTPPTYSFEHTLRA